MRLNLLLCLLVATIVIPTQAQDELSIPTLNIGDPAPPLELSTWFKGTPIQNFEKGKCYVLEFWATWCQPCKAAMPHLSALAQKYQDKVTILGIDVYENRPFDKVKAFIDSMGNKMDYQVAADDSNAMVAGWLKAAGTEVDGIPVTFVVNAEGRLAWIGHPKDLDEVLVKMVNNTWNTEAALAKRKRDKLLYKMDEDAYYDLLNYRGDPQKPDDPGKPDSALLLIKKIVEKEPGLKYTFFIAAETFSLLLKTDLRQAYEYGKIAIVTPNYRFQAYEAILGTIKIYSEKQKLPAEIYRLGAEAQQIEIDQIPYPELVNIPRRYNQMAEWYSLANEKLQAIRAQQKAIDTLKNKNNFSAKELEEYQARLRRYKNL